MRPMGSLYIYMVRFKICPAVALKDDKTKQKLAGDNPKF